MVTPSPSVRATSQVLARRGRARDRVGEPVQGISWRDRADSATNVPCRLQPARCDRLGTALDIAAIAGSLARTSYATSALRHVALRQSRGRSRSLPATLVPGPARQSPLALSARTSADDQIPLT